MPKKKKAKKVVTNIPPKPEVVEEPKEEETVEVTEVVVEEVATEEQATEEETAQAQPQEVKEVSLEDKLLDIYNASPPGPIPISKLLGETGLAQQYDSRTGTALLSDAWVKLYEKGKVPSTQFVKES